MPRYHISPSLKVTPWKSNLIVKVNSSLLYSKVVREPRRFDSSPKCVRKARIPNAKNTCGHCSANGDGIILGRKSTNPVCKESHGRLLCINRPWSHGKVHFLASREYQNFRATEMDIVFDSFARSFYFFLFRFFFFSIHPYKYRIENKNESNIVEIFSFANFFDKFIKDIFMMCVRVSDKNKYNRMTQFSTTVHNQISKLKLKLYNPYDSI